MIALIDADVICYRAASVAVDEVDWGDGDGKSTMANRKSAFEVADRLVQAWTRAARCKRHLLVFSDRSAPKTSFRFHICPIYKSGRPEEKLPLHDEVLEYLQKTYRHVWYPGLEGDDTLGLLGTGPEGSKYVVVSIDKDMLTLPCRVVNPDHPKDKVRKLSLIVADYNWMFQTITGDRVDGYKGAPGAGPKKAAEVLALPKTLAGRWEAALRVYADQHDHKRWGDEFVTGSAFDEALMNARCARILRHGDYNDKTKQVRLWHPDLKEVEWINPF